MDTILLRQFLNHFCDHKRDDKRFCFILGAGASRESGIRTGGELAAEWFAELKDDLFKDNQGLFEEWVREKKIDEKDLAKSYPEVFDKRFYVDKEDGFAFLAEEMAGKEPSYGYSVLAQILAGTPNKVVITTNFDSLTEDALFIYTDTKPMVVVHESLANYIKPLTGRPVVVKVHRDLFFSPVNDETGTDKLSEAFVKGLTEVFNCYTPVVIGYGGNDGSLMGFLEKIEKISGGIYWCYRVEDELSARVKKLVEKHKGMVVQIAGFDALMAQLNDCLKYKRLDETLVEIAKKRADEYKTQYERLHESADPDTKKALEEMVDRSPRDWWYYGQKAREESDPDKQQKIYEDGMKTCLNSHELMGNYAIFLKNIRHDYDRAEELYKRALEIDPKAAGTLGNYAIFLSDIRHDNDRAEELFKRALEIDPKAAGTLGNYAIFLSDTRHDNDRAEELYKRALEIDPKYANTLGNYATFLSDIRQDYDRAEELYKQALEADPKNANILNNYASFLKNIRRDYDRAEELYKQALEADPKNANILNNYANFLKNIRRDYDRAEELYKQALEADPKNVSAFGNYANFMNDIRQNYGRAEELYKRSLEEAPKNANTIGNYAKLLIDKGDDLAQVDSKINQALELNSSKSPNALELELYFYRYAVLWEKYPDALGQVEALLAQGGRSPGWILDNVIKRAKALGHPDINKLEVLAKQIAEPKPAAN